MKGKAILSLTLGGCFGLVAYGLLVLTDTQDALLCAAFVWRCRRLLFGLDAVTSTPFTQDVEYEIPIIKSEDLCVTARQRSSLF